MEDKLFNVVYNLITENLDVHLCPAEATARHNSLSFSNYPYLMMYVYAADEKEALKIARADIQNQLHILSKDIDRTIEGKLAEKSYRVTYNLLNSDISICEQEEDENDYPEDKVKHIGAYILEVVVIAHCKREAKDKALDLVSEYFSDITKKATERKKVVEEFDDED